MLGRQSSLGEERVRAPWSRAGDAEGTGFAKVGVRMREREESKNSLGFWPEPQGRHRLGGGRSTRMPRVF